MGWIDIVKPPQVRSLDIFTPQEGARLMNSIRISLPDRALTFLTSKLFIYYSIVLQAKVLLAPNYFLCLNGFDVR